MFTLNFSREFKEIESLNAALFHDDRPGMITERRKILSFFWKLIPPSILVSLMY